MCTQLFRSFGETERMHNAVYFKPEDFKMEENRAQVLGKHGELYEVPLVAIDTDSTVFDTQNLTGGFLFKRVITPVQMLSSKHMSGETFNILVTLKPDYKNGLLAVEMFKVKIILRNRKKALKLRKKKQRNK